MAAMADSPRRARVRPLLRDRHKPMTDPRQLWDALEAIYAYDIGSTDSGVHDELLRRQCIEKIEKMTDDELRLSLSRFCREAYLSEEALTYGYGVEDAAEFYRWIDSGEYKR